MGNPNIADFLVQNWESAVIEARKYLATVDVDLEAIVRNEFDPEIDTDYGDAEEYLEDSLLDMPRITLFNQFNYESYTITKIKDGQVSGIGILETDGLVTQKVEELSGDTILEILKYL